MENLDNISQIIRGELYFILYSSVSDFQKAGKMAETLTINLELRKYTNNSQLDQKTVDLEYILANSICKQLIDLHKTIETNIETLIERN